jgi:hypothetical protein
VGLFYEKLTAMSSKIYKRERPKFSIQEQFSLLLRARPRQIALRFLSLLAKVVIPHELSVSGSGLASALMKKNKSRRRTSYAQPEVLQTYLLKEIRRFSKFPSPCQFIFH